MPRPSMRPVSQRTAANSSGKKRSSAVPKLPENEDEDNDFRPRKKKNRTREQTRESDAKTREKFENELDEAAQNLIDAMDEDGTKAEKLVSVFAKDFKRLREKIAPENEELRIDEASASASRALLAMCYDLVAQAESNYRKTGKEGSMYALQALINQIRDLSNDVKLSEDLDGKLLVVKQLIDSNFVRMADFILREKYALHQNIDSLTTNASLRKAFRKELDNTVINFAKGMQEYKTLLITQVSLYLAGDPAYLNPGANSEEGNPEVKKRGRRKKK